MPTATRNKSKTALARQFANNYPRKMSLIRRSVNLASPLKAPSASIACPLVSNSPLLTPLAFQARPLIEEASPGRTVDASSTSSEPVEEASRALAEVDESRGPKRQQQASKTRHPPLGRCSLELLCALIAKKRIKAL